jgi:hypothetical protein
MAQSLAGHGQLTVKLEDVSRVVKLVSAKRTGEREALTLEMDATLTGARPVLPATATACDCDRLRLRPLTIR